MYNEKESWALKLVQYRLQRETKIMPSLSNRLQFDRSDIGGQMITVFQPLAKHLQHAH
jgi:hypothetical protein